MTSFSAKSLQNHTPLPVVFVVYPGIALLDLAGPLQVMSWVKLGASEALGYDTAIASLEGGRVPSDTLIQVDATPIEEWIGREIDTLIVVGGDGVYAAMQEPRLVNGVARLAAQARRVCSVCSGALLLAQAGLLDGRRAVTHWDDTDALIQGFPRVEVETDPIYVKDGHIWTSAGVTAGTDMALAIVAEDFGQDAALRRARSLVTYMVRPGGQSQFSAALERQSAEGAAQFEDLHRWIEENLGADLRVERLAARENMSPRNFHRLYTATMGTTPAKAVEAMRLQAARDMLETSQASIKAVADRCGFGDEERMRRAFMRLMGVSPSGYRQRFQIT